MKALNLCNDRVTGVWPQIPTPRADFMFAINRERLRNSLLNPLHRFTRLQIINSTSAS